MTWLDRIKQFRIRPGETLDSVDRRAFLIGGTVTAAGLVIPAKKLFFPSSPVPIYNPYDGDLHVALHMAQPTQAHPNELVYDGYSRVRVPLKVHHRRDAPLVRNEKEISFPEALGGWGTATHAAVWHGNKLLHSTSLFHVLHVSNGVQPLFKAGDLLITES